MRKCELSKAKKYLRKKNIYTNGRVSFETKESIYKRYEIL